MSSSKKSKGPKPKVAKKSRNPQFITLYSAPNGSAETLVKPESKSVKRLRLFLEAAVLRTIEIDDAKVVRFVEGFVATDILRLRLELNDKERSMWTINVSLFPPNVYDNRKTAYSCSIDVCRKDEIVHEAIDPMDDFLDKEALKELDKKLDQLLGQELAESFSGVKTKVAFVKRVCEELILRIERAGVRLKESAVDAPAKSEAAMTERIAKFMSASVISRRYS